MATERKPKLTLEERAQILKEHGIDVRKAYIEDRGPVGEGRKERVKVPVILFGGDTSEGHRAARIMIEHGIDVYQIEHSWTYGPGAKAPINRDEEYGLWSISFYK